MDEPEHPWLEPDEEFEGVGAHVDNPRYNHQAALAERGLSRETDEPA